MTAERAKRVGEHEMAGFYEIIVKRQKVQGTLFFSSAGITVETTVWWDKDVVIEASETGYPSWKTHMATKKDSVTGEKRPGIWLGKDIAYAKGTKTSNAIFLHEGSSRAWSDGCIVCDRTHFMKMWNAIEPSSQPNVLVKVTDE